MRSGRLRRGALALGVVALLSSVTGLVFTGPASAGSATVTPTPSTGLVNGQSISVDVVLAEATPAGVFVAVRQCGNADSAGTPLAAVTLGDCGGGEALGPGYLKLIGFPSGGIAAGTQNVTLVAGQNDIGSNLAKCIPVPPATLPCAIRAQTVQGSTAYTGPGYFFDSTSTIAYAEGGPTTTTLAPTTTTAAPGTTTTTTAAPTTTTTAAPTTKTFDCTDIPIAASTLVVTPNRCITDGQQVTVSAPAGAHAADVSVQATVFIVECNPDPAIPASPPGGGCNIGGLATAGVAPDGSIPATPISLKTGQIGSDPGSQCPPTQAQADAGVVNCVIKVGTGSDDPHPLAGAVTFAGQTLVLPVDATGNPVTGGPGTAGGSVTTAGASATTGSSVLAFTGSTTTTLWLAGIALALLDLGYLAFSSTWTRRRRYLFRRS